MEARSHSLIGNLFAVAALAAVAALPHEVRADSTWVGPRISTDSAAWNIAANWNGGVPTGSVKATITYDANGLTNYFLSFTPPLDFTGQISVSRDSTTWDIRWPNYVKLTVLDGATWTVVGNGHLIATEGIAARIGSTSGSMFSGTIVIPPSVSFTAASTLNANVEFVGKGTLTLTTTNQLSHISGFSGTLVWNGPGGASLTPVDIAVLQQHGIRLGDGASINLRDRFLAINGVRKIPDWNDAASDWSFNGTNTVSSSSFNLDADPPHANAAGELELVNDGGQVHSVFFKGYKLKMHDSWGLSFHWKHNGELPQKYIDAGKSQAWSGMFGFYLVADPTTYGTLWQPGGNGHGFGIDFYLDQIGWQRNRSSIGGGAVSMKRELLSALGEGFDIHEEADVDITCQNGTLTVTMTQGDKMFSVQRPTFNQENTMAQVPDGYYIGFAASGDYWEDAAHGVPLVTHTISNFRGWYRAREAHGWQQVPDNVYPFTSANCTARIYTDASTYVENAAALESDGSFRLESYDVATRNIIRSNYNFDRTKRYLVQFDLVAGTGTAAENTEYMNLGLSRCSDAISTWVYSYARLGNDEWDGYSRPIALKTRWYDGYSTFFANSQSNVERWRSQGFTTPKMIKETTIHVGFLYDGLAGAYYQAHSGKHSMDIGWIPPESVQSGWFVFDYAVRFQISHYSSWGRVDTVLKNFTIKRLDTPDTSYVGGEISVATNATATLLADASAASSPIAAAQVRKVSLAPGAELAVATDVSGSRVEIESLAISGADAQISSTAKTTIGGDLTFTGGIPSSAAVFAGDVTFDGPAVLTVPTAWSETRLVRIPLFTLASTTSGVLPSGYRVVTDEGEDVTAKANVIVHANSVSLSFGKGFVLMLR